MHSRVASPRRGPALLGFPPSQVPSLLRPWSENAARRSRYRGLTSTGKRKRADENNRTCLTMGINLVMVPRNEEGNYSPMVVGPRNG